MSGAHVFIDRSQFPENVRHDLLASLHAHSINPKFHYESYKQAAKWLALHNVYSPARTNASCHRTYDAAFTKAAVETGSARKHIVGLGCGGGQKEARLLELLGVNKPSNVCTLVDVSLPLVLTARAAALPFADKCAVVVCDLGTTESLHEIIDATDDRLPRIITMFGIIPNFESTPLLSRVSSLLRKDDLLLMSANLAPGFDYTESVEKILPQYDNALTRDWLMTLLLDLGFEAPDGDLIFTIESDLANLKRVMAYFRLNHSRQIIVSGEDLSFRAGESIRVFFSYRHTPETIRLLLNKHALEVNGAWLNDSAEEGVFLCRKSTQSVTR